MHDWVGNDSMMVPSTFKHGEQRPYLAGELC